MRELLARQTGATSPAVRQDGRSLTVIPDFQSPSAAIIGMQVPRVARGTVWMISAMFTASVLAMGLIPTDRVVTAPGKVISRAHPLVVQPLETAIIRSIDVAEGQTVHAGDLLAKLDPTFVTADVASLVSQVAALQAEVERLQAESEDRPFVENGHDPNRLLQMAIAAQRAAERRFKRETYQQRIDGLQANIARSVADAQAYTARMGIAEKTVSIRKELEQRQVGNVLASLSAIDSQLEMGRARNNANESAESARRELAAIEAERDAYHQNWHADISQKLSEQKVKLADAREQLSKARLRRDLVELRSDRDAIVLTVAKVSVGSVLQSSEQLMTLVPADAPLEVEANIAGRDHGFVRPGDPVAIKFDTFSFSQYGLAYGAVRTISADSFSAQESQNQKTRSVSAGANTGSSAEAFYRARISIDEVKLHDVPRGFQIAPGMPTTADIKVGRRTVLSYLLGRILPTMSQGMREP
jgi:hemolysin D